MKVSVAVQYFVIADKVYDAYYKLTDHRAQIRSYVFDGIRSSLPKLDLDHAFSSKSEIADNVKNSLADLMDDYGYRIVNVLIVDLDPDNAVKNAMNEINGQSFFLFFLFFLLTHFHSLHLCLNSFSKTSCC